MASQTIRDLSEKPDGAIQPSGLGRDGQEVRSYKGPPSLAITEHWNYEDKGKDFFGGYSYMSQGPLPQLWANTQMSAHGLWGDRLIAEMANYNHAGRSEDRRGNATAGTEPRHAGR